MVSPVSRRGGPEARSRPLWMRIILVLAAFGFVLGIYLSWRAQPDLLDKLALGPLLYVIGIGIPLTVLLNILEFQTSARLVYQHFSLGRSAEITIIGSVANMLPIPGGTMVRVAALKAGGASLGRGTSVTLLVSGLWIGISFLYSGLWLFGLGVSDFHLGGLLVGSGLAALAICLALCLRLSRDWSVIGKLVGIKVGLVVTDATRLFACLLAIGHMTGFAQASVLAVSGVLGAAVSIVPAGLGIREGAAALLAPIVLVSVPAAYLAASLNRITGLAIMAPVAMYLALRRTQSDPATDRG